LNRPSAIPLIELRVVFLEALLVETRLFQRLPFEKAVDALVASDANLHLPRKPIPLVAKSTFLLENV